MIAWKRDRSIASVVVLFVLVLASGIAHAANIDDMEIDQGVGFEGDPTGGFTGDLKANSGSDAAPFMFPFGLCTPMPMAPLVFPPALQFYQTDRDRYEALETVSLRRIMTDSSDDGATL